MLTVGQICNQNPYLFFRTRMDKKILRLLYACQRPCAKGTGCRLLQHLLIWMKKPYVRVRAPWQELRRSTSRRGKRVIRSLLLVSLRERPSGEAAEQIVQGPEVAAPGHDRTVRKGGARSRPAPPPSSGAKTTATGALDWITGLDWTGLDWTARARRDGPREPLQLGPHNPTRTAAPARSPSRPTLSYAARHSTPLPGPLLALASPPCPLLLFYRYHQ
jgi:hypothetical protein